MIDGNPIVPRPVYHHLLEPEITDDANRDLCVIRVICRGKSNGRPATCTLDLVERYDEATGFTAMEKLTGWHAAMVAILSAKGEVLCGGIPVESVLSSEQIAQESAKRGWKVQNKTMV